MSTVRDNRYDDGTKKRKAGSRHRKVTQKERDQQLSRNKRNAERRELVENFKRYHDPHNIFVLLIEEETDNNEKVLLERTELADGVYTCDLPVLRMEDAALLESLDIERMLRNRFGITSENYELLPDERMLVVRNIKLDQSGFESHVIRTYNPATWFSGNMTSQIGKTLYYGGTFTDPYLASVNDLGKIIISSDMLCKVLDYRKHENKIDYYAGVYGGTNYRVRDTTDFLYAFYDRPILEKLSREESELMYLLHGSRRGPIIQDIHSFMRTLRASKDKMEELSKLSSESDDLFDFMNRAHEPMKEVVKTYGGYFSNVRKSYDQINE